MGSPIDGADQVESVAAKRELRRSMRALRRNVDDPDGRSRRIWELVEAVAEELSRVAREEFGLRPRGVEGRTSARWMLVDFGDVIVHVFDEAMRAFYDLDGLWIDAPRMDLPDIVIDDEPTEPVFHLP